ncbi:sugar ABC transporter permease [Candidatus Pelagibacter bacterium]|jgi:glucose/mannose transport system permease protein|uniref:Sugar ABC transporter permease n=1 Tax=Candidatus Pelagibacter giovannonii TaxID=2563896 RepID=A0A6H1Q108_9PROT|nr:sugar ABC transporter permease [Candidatus Pelagibacter giovannonii]MDA7565227.1 sugar ABC transporter permease [Candidatus Pelagibacter sp.]MDB2485467.1 sugar ABC transporter permease [Candidatus Pelagibacter bacterium]MDA7594508.1 sugar ABC transporter permease [Candidatus Pelagibacter sp.]MDB9699413.1 sugar ABC transporter permease [Candidatus Pelagibacter sp.]MDC0455653.1 sugar ABC transporter permease [Candidatus Pelagibacter sp.]
MFWLKKNLPKLVLTPSLGILSWFVYGFIFWTIYISFTKSKMLPRYEIWGIDQYIRLWKMPRWHVAVENLLIFTVLFIILCIAIGILLSILLDQKIRAEGFLRTIYLYPMALSFIVTGTAWKWVLNPTLGIEKFAHDMGFETFKFDWLVTPEMSIYTIVIAGVWQSSGFIMAIFLAGLRSVDDEIIKAAKIDGAGIFSIYSKIILPMMRPVFMSAIVILVHLSIKSYDLIIALTSGGPGISSDMPAVFMTTMAFHRSEVGLASASAIMMFLTVSAIVVPYLYSELKREDAR